jgi:3-oxoacyl-[acyl-carrier protein] reductase
MISHGGSIINMSSVIGMNGAIGAANYAASKAGIIGLTKSFAREYGGYGIRVNAIAPGWINNTGTFSGINSKKLDNILKQLPLRRFGEPEEIARTALFLASDDSSYITGQVIVVDGGGGELCSMRIDK